MDDACEKLDVVAFLARVGIVSSAVRHDIGFLSELHEAFMLHVPFESLEIHVRREIVLDIQKLFSKVVYQKRGGFCFELNGVFDAAIRRLGFHSRKVGAKVWDGTKFGYERHHMAILVDLQGQQYLVDVGFGDSFIRPLRFVLDEEQNDPSGRYRIRKLDSRWYGLECFKQDGYQMNYCFNLDHVSLADFVEPCRYQQTSPESIFVQKPICSICTPNGRLTLTRRKYIDTAGSVKRERDISNFDDVLSLLASQFGISFTFRNDEKQYLRNAFLQDAEF